MLKKITHNAFVVVLTFLPWMVNAQSAGDYRSNSASSNWSTVASWETYNGSAWVAASDYPGQNAGAGTVTIRDGHTITLDVSISNPNAIGALVVGEGNSGTLNTVTTGNRTLPITNDLTIAAGATYDLTRTTLTVNGITTVNGTISDSHTSGSSVFVGKVIVNSGGSFSPTANGSTYTFRGGIDNDGTFSKTGTGGVTFDTNNQDIDGSQPITIAGTITVTGVTITNKSTDLSLTSTAAGALTGSGTWIQATGSVLKFSGASITISSTDFDSNVNTVNYTRGGSQTVLSDTYHHLIISTSGTKTLGGNITINGNLSITGSATLASDIYQITGNATGTFSTGAGTTLSLGNTGNATEVLFPINFTSGNISLNSASTVIYQNNATQTVSSTPTYGNLTIAGGGRKTINGNLTINGALAVNAGTFDFGSSVARSVSVAGNLSGAGAIDMSGGSLLHSLTLSGANNAITTFTTAAVASTVTYNGSMAQQVFASTNYRNLVISNNSTKTIQGTVTVNGDLTINSGATLTQAAQSLTVLGNTTIYGSLYDNNANGSTSLQDVDLSGGSIDGSATDDVTINGNLSMPSGNGIIGRVNLTVSGTTTVATGRSLTLNNNNGVKIFTGAITINGTGTWNSTSVTTTANLEIRGGITNNNSSTAFAAGGATFSTNNQSLAGAGAYTFANAVSIAGAITVTNQSSHSSGVTFNSTVDGTNASSTWKNDLNAITYYQPAASTQPMNTGILDVSANGNYFYYNRGNTQNVKVPLTSYHHLSITGGGGTTTLLGTTDVNGNFYIATSNSFNPAGYDFTVDGNTTINGTFADATLAGTSNLQDVDLSGGNISGSVNGVVNINGNLTMPTGNGTIGRVALTVSGTTTVASGRSLTLNNNNGAKIFVGAITVNGTGTWTSTAVTTTANLEIRGGISNNNSSAAFACGGATFSTNNQNLAGAGAYTFGNAVSITGAITITNQSSNSNGVTFSNTINGTDVASTWRNDPNTTVYYQPAANTQPMNIGVLDVSASGNYFYYSRAGAQNIKSPLSSYYNLYITGGGTSTKTMQSDITCGGNLYVAASTTLSVSTYSLSVTGTTTLDGAITDASNSGTNTFSGLLDINSGGSVSTANNSPFIFEGGITNDGTFSKTGTGAVSFNTNNQDINGTSAITMAGNVTIGAGITVTYKNTSASGITLTGILDGANSSSTWKNDVNSTVYYQPASATQPMNTGILDVSASGNNFHYSRTAAQTIKTPSTAYYNLIISGGGSVTKTLGGNTTVNGNLTIAASTTLDVDNAQNYSLTLKGNFLNSGTFQARNGTVTLSGTSDQAVTSNASTFYNLVINNSATQVTLNDNLTVSNLLTLTDGVVTTGSNRVIITNTSVSSLGGYSSGSFVNGYLRRYIGSNTDTYVFPVGNGTSTTNYYRADLINNNLAGITYIDSRFKALSGHNDSEMNVWDNWEHGSLVYNTIHTAGVWELEPNSAPTGGNYSIRLYIANMDGFTDNNFGPLKRPVGSTSGADWSTGGGTLNNNNAAGRTVASGYMQRNGLTSFSEFGGGSGSGGGAGLPIELVSFTATLVDGEVKIEWTTATETDNDYFTVERSKDAVSFETFAIIDAAGNSNQPRLYSTVDRQPFPGISYYRLKQTDFDGQESYSNVAAISIMENESIISLSPNPVINRQVNINTNGSAVEQLSASTFTLSDLAGKLIFKKNVNITSEEDYAIELPTTLPVGWYIARLKFADSSRLWKLLIK